MFNPHYYPYLFKTKDSEMTPVGPMMHAMNKPAPIVEYVNPNDKGYYQNVKLFLKQAFVSQLIIK